MESGARTGETNPEPGEVGGFWAGEGVALPAELWDWPGGPEAPRPRAAPREPGGRVPAGEAGTRAVGGAPGDARPWVSRPGGGGALAGRAGLGPPAGGHTAAPHLVIRVCLRRHRPARANFLEELPVHLQVLRGSLGGQEQLAEAGPDAALAPDQARGAVSAQPPAAPARRPQPPGPIRLLSSSSTGSRRVRLNSVLHYF